MFLYLRMTLTYITMKCCFPCIQIWSKIAFDLIEVAQICLGVMNPFVAFEDGKGPLSYPLLKGTSAL